MTIPDNTPKAPGPPSGHANPFPWWAWGLFFLVTFVVILYFGSWAFGAVIDGSAVTQGPVSSTPQTTTGASANSLRMSRSKYRAMVVTIWNTAGTATVQMEISCVPTPPGPIWAPVRGSSTPLATGEAVALDVVYPGCEYRMNATACAGCSLNGFFYTLPEIQ